LFLLCISSKFAHASCFDNQGGCKWLPVMLWIWEWNIRILKKEIILAW
jgi:hypothetical protein